MQTFENGAVNFKYFTQEGARYQQRIPVFNKVCCYFYIFWSFGTVGFNTYLGVE